MRKSIAVLLASGLMLTGCSGWQASRVNPSNWFGGSQATETAVDANAEPVNALLPESSGAGIFSRPDASTEDQSVAVASVTELKVEKTPSGAIIYATGLASRQGAYGVWLRLNPDADSNTLDYSFRALYPEYQTPVGSETSRTLRVAVSLTHQDLAGVKLVRVSSDSNARETRR